MASVLHISLTGGKLTLRFSPLDFAYLYLALFRDALAAGLAMTKTIYSQRLQSNTDFFFILRLNHIHLIPLQLKTKPKCSTDLNRPHLDRQGGELI